MESLYTKYRPQTFADVVGQTHVVKTLQHAILEGRISHAYLFCGPRGTGKTTMARLLAKALMCELGEGHLPDGTCEQCRLIAAGEHPDVYELDAASRTGVDNVREEIISRVSFAPVRGRYKMYIIDEVHMLTTAAFNALLKTLEEPPSHVVFVLCTTDPQKIPETILSRVQRFDFHAIGNADIQARLAYICEREGFSYDPEALELVVRHARGGMRDAISELEQLSVSGGGSISVDVARDVLGEVSASTLERMSLAMANRDVPTLFAQVESLVEVGRDLLQFTRALAARLRDVYVVAAIGAKSAAVSASETDLPAISREALAFGSVDRVGRALQLLSDASTEMRVAPNQRLVLEVALTKIARPQAELTLEALADRVASLERQVAALAAPEARREARSSSAASTTASAAPAKERPAAKPAEAVQAAPSRQAKQERGEAPATAPVASGEAPRSQGGRMQSTATTPVSAPTASASAAQAPAQPTAPVRSVPRTAPTSAAAQTPATTSAPAASPAPTSAVPVIVDQGELQRRWKQVVDSLQASRPQHGSLLLNATIVSDDGTQLLVSLPKGSGFACKMLDRPDVRAHLDPLIARVFGPRKAHFAEENVIATMVARGAVAAPTASVSATQEAPRAESPASSQVKMSANQQTQPEVAAPQQTYQQQVSAPQQHTYQQPSTWQQAPAPQQTQSSRQAPAPQQTWNSQPAQAPQQAQPMRQAPTLQQSWNPQQAQAPQQASTPQQASVPQQAPRQTTPAQTPSYPAPWDPLPVDDDQVPYGDLDAAPYEEDYIFGTVDEGTMRAFGASTHQSPQAPVAQASQLPQQPPQVIPWQAPAPQVAQEAPAPKSEPVSVPEPMTEPKPEPAPEPTPELTRATSAEAAPQTPPEPPATEPAAQDVQKEEPAPKRTRSPRQTGGVPHDLAAMLTSVFGEGITFTEVPPDDPSETDEAESALAEQGLDGENEYADEPVDNTPRA